MEDARVVRARHAPEKQAQAQRLRREMTAPEARLWQRLRANRLGGLHFRRQQVIDGFIVDFYCHAAKLVVEVDGEVHDAQAEYDAQRTDLLAGRGLRVLRVTNARVNTDLVSVLDDILRAATSGPA